jgi:hypothetical protein
VEVVEQKVSKCLVARVAVTLALTAVVGVGWLGNHYWEAGNSSARTVPGCGAIDSARTAEFVIPRVEAGNTTASHFGRTRGCLSSSRP